MTRILVPAALLALTLPAAADEPARNPPPVKTAAALVAVERRLAELEYHLAATLKEVQALRQEVQDLSKKGGGADTGVSSFKFKLQHARAADTAKTLQSLLLGGRGQQLKITYDAATNWLYVTGSA